MSEVVRAIITNHRFPNSFIHLYFQLHHKGDHLPFISFVIMPLSCAAAETNQIFLFSQELSLSRRHFYPIIPWLSLGLNKPVRAMMRDEGFCVGGPSGHHLGNAAYIHFRLLIILRAASLMPMSGSSRRAPSSSLNESRTFCFPSSLSRFNANPRILRSLSFRHFRYTSR